MLGEIAAAVALLLGGEWAGVRTRVRREEARGRRIATRARITRARTLALTSAWRTLLFPNSEHSLTDDATLDVERLIISPPICACVLFFVLLLNQSSKTSRLVTFFSWPGRFNCEYWIFVSSIAKRMMSRTLLPLTKEVFRRGLWSPLVTVAAASTCLGIHDQILAERWSK